MLRSPILVAALTTIAALVAACDHKPTATSATGGCDESLKLPPGFCATVFAESAGPARHLVVRKNGDVIVGVLDQRRQPGGLLALRDTNHDGHADVAERFGESAVHGVALANDSTLYASTADAILRFRFADSITPRKRVDTIVTGLAKRPLPSHSIAIDARGNLVVNIGAATNGCAPNDASQVRGRDPCPELETSGGIWRFSVDRNNQTIKDGTRLATGLHNAIALAINPRDTMTYAVSHGRDGLHDAWPSLYTEQEAATAAAEEMIRIQSVRADFGWPYCYYDYLKAQRFLAPEYGGDKQQIGRCDRLIQPLIAFPAHWAPMSMLFYSGKMFPANYQGGAFIAFHGSAYRSPLPEEGYHVIFLQFKDGQAADYTAFATGFAGGMAGPAGAAHRPVGLAQGPDGALYISDDKGGRIWRVTYSAK
jgi:glucose/arabinose dehydrogenase